MRTKHVVISGTGRTGTTFLVELLNKLGLDTGVNNGKVTRKDEVANAGLEFDLRKQGAPYIVKSPHFCDYADEVLNRDDLEIEHVFIPMRNLKAAAESRRRVTKLNKEKFSVKKRIRIVWQKLRGTYKQKVFSGGLWSTGNESDQENILLKKNYDLLLALSDAEVQVTLLKYPRHLKDSSYLYGKLRPILGDISFEAFDDAHRQTVQPGLIHSFDNNDK